LIYIGGVGMNKAALSGVPAMKAIVKVKEGLHAAKVYVNWNEEDYWEDRSICGKAG